MKWNLQSCKAMILSCQACIWKCIAHSPEPSQLHSLGLGRGGKPSLLLVSSFPTSPQMFDWAYDFEWTLHSALEQPSYMAGGEDAFHSGM